MSKRCRTSASDKWWYETPTREGTEDEQIWGVWVCLGDEDIRIPVLGPSKEEVKRRADLITAAPKMRDALRALLDTPHLLPELWDQAREALLNAEGGAQ
jgi:hypothetical protein